jgi:hypothetical protein
MNVSQTTLFFSEFGRVGRVFLQPDARTAAAKEGFRWGGRFFPHYLSWGILGHQTVNVVFILLFNRVYGLEIQLVVCLYRGGGIGLFGEHIQHIYSIYTVYLTWSIFKKS